MAIENLITDHLDLWTAAVRPKSSAGRGTSSKLELTGIKKLRELILELAVRGKLVPQDPSDEPASVLLERIAAERVRLVKEKKIKKSKALPEIGEEEKPFELPEGWEWKRLGDIVEVLDSMRRPITKHARSNGTYPYYGASGIVDYIDDFIFDEPLVLVGEDGAKWGKGERTAFSIDGKSWVNNHAHVIRPEKAVIVDEYLVYFLTACDLNKFITGITVPKLNQARLVSIPLAIPSIEEQHRIVAKVDELMALCDQLEQRSESQLAAHQTLVETLLATLTDSADADELAQNWARLSTHFDSLFTTEASIDALKQTILQLAVMGKLVSQDPSDEPAAALLERIAAEKAQLVKEKKIKKEKPLPAISEDEKPFELPQGWAWVRLGTLCGLITSGSRGWNQYYSDVGSIFIRSQDIKFDSLLFDDRAYVNLPNRTEGTRTRVEFGDMLMTITGANVAKVAIVSECFDDAYVSQHVALIRLIDNSLNKFIHVWLTCNGGGRKLLLDLSYGAKPGLNLNNINEVLVPLAPQNMQETILGRVNELMTLCDRLKSRLATSQQTQLALAESLVEGALV
ncbi:type I restriction endonuclease EcoAI subunit S [Aeromonas caviae]|uniref:restriction endonuclease subunit S n=1 Tax=Aeromonas caviae TaxID=648 RepID=UPI001EEEF6F3|nr:restriction endonuclease subunit S [Aeromonas caviae]MCR3931204.1 restriction endonuclease subunit S [Aeromonas caviae]BDC89139.1 type I restriction endonuclease EcoAI subunit S [Aeromonas caviae]